MKKLFIMLAAITTQFVSAQVPSYAPTAGLQGWYPFSGNANDFSTNTNNGTATGATLTSDRFGNVNSAYSFNGTNNYISINSVAMQQFTLSSWIYITAINPSNLNGIISNLYSSPVYTGFEFRVQPDSTLMLVCGDGNTWLQPITTFKLTNNAWYNVVATNDNSTIRIYVNSQLITSYSVSNFTNNTSNIIFGTRDLAPNGGWFSGKLDDIGFWNRALTLSEITNLYNACTTAPTASISAIGNTTFCSGSDVILKCTTTGNGLAYQWKKGSNNITGATSSTYNAIASANYKCIVTNACGTATSNAIGVTALPNASIKLTTSGNASFCAGDSVTINASNPGVGYSLQWLRNNVSILGVNGLTYIAKQSGTYKVFSVNTANNCSRYNSSSVTTIVNCRMANPYIVAVANSSESTDKINISNPADKNIFIFPNPSSGSFTFEYTGFEQEGSATLQVINTLGQTIYTEEAIITDGSIHQEINLGNALPNGIYVIKLLVNNIKVADSKVILQ